MHADFKVGILCGDVYIQYVFRNRGGELGGGVVKIQA